MSDELSTMMFGAEARPPWTADAETRRECDRASWRIAVELVRDAIWDGDLCNWMGKDWEPESWPGVPSFYVLRPNLAAGAPGICITLARNHVIRPDRRLSTTILGGLRQSLTDYRRVDANRAPGLHSGWGGLCVAILECSRLLRSSELLESAIGVANDIVEAPASTASFDLMSGTAGTLVALLHVYAHTGDRKYVEVAERQGEILVNHAVKRDEGWSWPSALNSASSRRHLCGMSHGASGIAWALVELFGVTRDVRWRSAAIAAFDYEAQWFDSDRGNWPDFRQPDEATSSTRRFVSGWCNGSPGIVLARLRAHEVLGDSRWLREASEGMKSVLLALDRDALGSSDFSLCHGVFGRLQVAEMAQRHGVLGGSIDIVSAVLHRALEAHSVREVPWPCGASYGFTTPGLMTGLAGIGYVLLGIARSEVGLSPCLPVPLLQSTV